MTIVKDNESGLWGVLRTQGGIYGDGALHICLSKEDAERLMVQLQKLGWN